MDIRTKLVFALVAVSLGSMLALGAFSYDATREQLQRLALRQLDALAESKKEDLERVMVAWQDRVQLVTSRTALRDRLMRYRKTRDPEDAATIQRILVDAESAVDALRGISVFTADRQHVASAGVDPGRKMGIGVFWHLNEPLVFEDVTLSDEGELLITFVAPIRLEGELIGAAKVLHSARELIDVTSEYTGLGESGETILARANLEDGALVLNPLRHDPEAALRRNIAGDSQDPVLAAIAGEEGVFQDGVDYRGEPVWAATRHLRGLDWGLVVKVDTAEESRPVVELRDTMWKLAVSLSAFAIIAGLVLGLYFARPIHRLADVARRIGEGELELRAPVTSEDEIGLLAATINQMAEALVNRNDPERRDRNSS
ncbi:MAG: HAMP domain-containing protein [Myxococcota bacterium]